MKLYLMITRSLLKKITEQKEKLDSVKEEQRKSKNEKLRLKDQE